MASFVNPFSGMVPPRKMTNEELVRALRLDLAAEEEAIHLYTAHADATDNYAVAGILRDVADEERVHIGEFLSAIEALTDETRFLEKGAEEVRAKFPSLIMRTVRIQ